MLVGADQRESAATSQAASRPATGAIPILPQTPAAQNDKAPSSEEKTGLKVGRRDWTRTNDPHHVKVVL